jgi:hypothetical protein
MPHVGHGVDRGRWMASRRVTALTILASFLALAVLSFLGNPVLSVIFIVAAGAVLTHHALRLCPRCSNTACAFNPRFDGSAPENGGDGGETSDLDINRTTVIPLLLTGPLAVIGAWQFSPYWTLGVAAVALSAHFVFRRLTCSHCGNRCVANCNAVYRRSRLSGTEAHG